MEAAKKQSQSKPISESFLSHLDRAEVRILALRQAQGRLKYSEFCILCSAGEQEEKNRLEELLINRIKKKTCANKNEPFFRPVFPIIIGLAAKPINARYAGKLLRY